MTEIKIIADASNARRTAQRMTEKTGVEHIRLPAPDGQKGWVVIPNPAIVEEIQAEEAAMQNAAPGNYDDLTPAQEEELADIAGHTPEYMAHLEATQDEAGSDADEATSPAGWRAPDAPAPLPGRFILETLVDADQAEAIGALIAGYFGKPIEVNYAGRLAVVVPPAKPAREPGAPRANNRLAAAMEAAQAGTLPEAPDFSAETHKAYRKRLTKVQEMIDAGDVDGLREFPIKEAGSTSKALIRFRDLAVMALEARRAA